MTHDDWRGIRVRIGLFEEIERYITSATKYGVPKYNSKAEFVEKACIMLLEKERNKVEVPARS